MTFEELIETSKYLLEQQKERLLEDIAYLKSHKDEENYMNFLDMVLEKVADLRVADLSTSERQQIKYILQDLGVEVHD